MDVFAVSTGDESSRYKTFQNGVWETEWTTLGGIAKSPLVVCSLGRDNMAVAVIGGEAAEKLRVLSATSSSDLLATGVRA